MDSESFFFLKICGKIVQALAILALSILAYNVFHEYQDTKFKLQSQALDAKTNADRLSLGYVTLFDPVTQQNVLVRQECK